jgi:hypothetical protein
MKEKEAAIEMASVQRVFNEVLESLNSYLVGAKEIISDLHKDLSKFPRPEHDEI